MQNNTLYRLLDNLNKISCLKYNLDQILKQTYIYEEKSFYI